MTAVRDPTTTRAWQLRRQRWAARLPLPCLRCGQQVQPWDAWDLDHATARALGGTDDDTWPSHASCNRSDGAKLGASLQRVGAAFLTGDAGSLLPPPVSHPPLELIRADHDEIADDSPDLASSVWDRAEWLAELRATMPAAATWPRYMSAPHVDAVGSYGAEAVAWLELETGLRLRWWQRLALTRALEHDGDGALVWLEVLLSTARQVGKSTLLRGLALWRIHAAGPIGEEQLVMHTGKDLPVCVEVMRPARVWARQRDGYKVREANGQTELAAPDGSRWLVRGRYSVYGYAVSLGIVDEAWHIAAEIVEDGIEPTLAERAWPQLWLTSTAHRKSTSLFPTRRAAAAVSLSGPGSSLLLEWSAPGAVELEDRDAWRRASPHWSPQRERLLEAKLTRVRSGVSDDPDEDDPLESFRAQYLNIWPGRRLLSSARDEALTDEATWRRAAQLSAAAPRALILAVEDHYGLAASAAAAGLLADGRVLVFGSTFGSRAEALAWCGWQASAHDVGRLVAGASLANDADVLGLGLEIAPGSTATTSAALPMLRQLLADGRLVHDGAADLAGQVVALRVTPSRSGGGLNISSRSGRSDLAKCAAWAACEAVRSPAPLPFFVH